jgi:hypothetical protein
MTRCWLSVRVDHVAAHRAGLVMPWIAWPAYRAGADRALDRVAGCRAGLVMPWIAWPAYRDAG